MGDEVKSADVVETLDAMLAHKIFAASPKAQDFLRYIVTESLAGRAKGLTGTTIAQDVYAKDENFDSMQDSVVRVTARRVRYMLQDYYSQCETEPKVKITIPKGKYRPHFECLITSRTKSAPPTAAATELGPIEAAIKPSKPKHHKVLWGAGLFVALSFMTAFALFPSNTGIGSSANKAEIASYPSVAIIPFTNQTDNDAYAFLEKGLQKQMTEDLSRFTLIRPIAYDGAYESLLAEKSPKYDYAITGVMLGVEPEIDIYVKLIDINETNVIFEDRIRRVPGQSQYYDALFNMVSELSGNFAGMEGVIVKDRLGAIQDKIAAGTDSLSDLTAFECHSLIDKLLDGPTPEKYKTLYGCLDSLLETDPENDTLLAAFGWVTYVGATSHEPVLKARSINPDIRAEEGQAMIEEALELNPENAWAQQVLSSLKLYQGNIKDALKHAELAVLENPANPDNLTWLGICLAHSGDWDRAMHFAQEALDRNPDAPASYHYTFFLKGLYENDADMMKNTAKVFADKESYYARLYSYIAAIAANDKPMAKRLKPYIDEMEKRNDGDIMSVIGSRMPSEQLKQNAERLLLKGETLFAEVGG